MRFAHSFGRARDWARQRIGLKRFLSAAWRQAAEQCLLVGTAAVGLPPAAGFVVGGDPTGPPGCLRAGLSCCRVDGRNRPAGFSLARHRSGPLAPAGRFCPALGRPRESAAVSCVVVPFFAWHGC